MYMVAFLALRILYVIALVCFVFVPCSPPESLPGKDVLCRLLPYVVINVSDGITVGFSPRLYC